MTDGGTNDPTSPGTQAGDLTTGSELTEPAGHDDIGPGGPGSDTAEPVGGGALGGRADPIAGTAGAEAGGGAETGGTGAD
jgi:hypothetical protein